MRLRPDIDVFVEIVDETEYGSPIGRRPQATARRAFAPFVDYVESVGPGELARHSAELLRRTRAGGLFGEITSATAAAWVVREDARFPDPERARHHRVTLSDGRSRLAIDVPRNGWAGLHDALSGVGGAGEIRALVDRDLLTSAEKSPPIDGDLVFVGHNTVVANAGSTRILVDPFIRPAAREWPAGYQPIDTAEIGAVDAICLTHSHADHFDPGSLLRFPAETLVLVPEIERETMLAVDLTRRLNELGFGNVRPLRWWSSTRVGSFEITALPFYGEQPTGGAVLHPDVRNVGNAYVVAAPNWSAAFLADSGRDHLGDVKDVATRWHRERGPVDIVFGGYRGWTTYPAGLIGSSVAQYAFFVPPEEWPVRQQLMNGADDLLDTAERFGAGWVVPYADGGAPWHWALGLGPRLDGDGVENPAFDPFPERVVEAAARRVVTGNGRAIASTVEVLLLRPGEVIRELPAAPSIVAIPGHVWPW